MSMSIKRTFIPLITFYSVTAVIMSKNLNFTNILIGGIILTISFYIHIKDNSIDKSVKLVVFIFYFLIFSIFFFYSRIIIFNIDRDFTSENRKDVILTGYICDITKDEEGKSNHT
jgi:heme/copper-type cytochrome/quinol oxidase subunit 4